MTKIEPLTGITAPDGFGIRHKIAPKNVELMNKINELVKAVNTLNSSPKK